MDINSIKTHFDRNVFLTFLLFLLVGLALLSFRINSTVDCTDIGFEVISNSFTTDDLIEFKSTDTSGVEWEWNFGDESGTMFRSNVLHQFKKPGKYTISLFMNGQCVTTKDIAISMRKQLIDPELVPNIIIPKHVRVGEEVEFSSDAKFAKSWQWSFGESLTIDGTSKKERYTFKKSGKKTILLVVNGDHRHEAKQLITVLEASRERRKRNISKRIDPIETVLRQQIIDKP
ncbi:MAG TPA: PKD domain-containing protein, partial [Pricia antarctica]|nr:PKD domain-containing protein [Pricia antarctica]